MEFSVESSINLPINLVEKEIDGYWIIIAPEYPNWIVLNKTEYKMFKYLKLNSILETLQLFYDETHLSEEECIKIMQQLLTKIELSSFYKDSIIYDEEPIDQIQKQIHINLTTNCNMRCSHCFLSAGLIPKQELNVSKIIDTIRKFEKIIGITDIVISGGEPLIHPNIFELLEGISNHNIILFTNGSLINEKNIELIAKYCNEVQISFEGVTKECYENIRGHSFNKVMESIELLKSKNMKIILAITILPNSMKDISDNLINFIEELNYENLEIRLNDEIEMSGNALDMDFSNYNKVEAKKIVIDLLNILISKGLASKVEKVRNVRFTNCGIGTNIVINFDGKIYPCNKFSDIYFESLEPNELVNKFNELNESTSNKYMNKCINCELRYICAGGCRIDNYIKNGNMLTPICDHEYKLEQYRRLLTDYLEDYEYE